MVFDKHPEYASKRDRSFWVWGYYVSTASNITEEAIKLHIKERRIKESSLL